MLKEPFKYIIILFLSIGFVYAEENKPLIGSGAIFDAAKDENNEIHPNIFLPLNWSNNWGTSIEYRTSQNITDEKVDGYDNSSNKTTLDHMVARISILNYNSHNNDNIDYSLGIGYGEENFEKKQVGYITSGSSTINFDNNIDITARGIELRGKVIYTKRDGLALKLGFMVAPSSILDVKQTTDITNYPTGKGLSSKEMDLAYEIRLDMLYKTSFFVDFALEGRYQFLPMKYFLLTSNSSLSYDITEYDVEEKITYVAIKILIASKLLGDWSPTIGFSRETTDGVEKIAGDSYKKEKDNVILGFNKRF